MSIFDRILKHRGIDGDLIDNFLLPKYEKSHDPFLLPDMDKAVDRLVSAKENNDKITIYGDYDIDGLRLDAADSIDFKFLRDLSAVCKNIKSDFWLTGEVVHGDYSKWIKDGHIDSTTNYECYKGM